MTCKKERNGSSYDWKKCCAIIFSISILLAIFLNLVAKENKHTELQRNVDVVVFFNKSNICQDNSCCVLNPSQEDTRCGGNCCSVKCRRFDTTTSNLSQVLESVIENDCKTQFIELDTEDIIFENNIMTPAWLISNNFEVRILTINSVHLKEILPQSFKEHIFKNLSYLILENLILARMQKGVFEGLNNLKYLFIYKSIFSDIDEDISYEINENLEILQIFESKLDLLKITGKASFQNLYLADLRFNTFEKIKAYTFAGLTNCQILHLSMSSISQIEEGAFKNMNMLRLLSLNNNSLEHLSVDIFDDNVLYQINLELHTNTWICDCELEWLQLYVLYRYKSDSTYRVPLCAQPNETLFSDIEFCPALITDDPSDFTTTDTTVSSQTTIDFQTSSSGTTESFSEIITTTESSILHPIMPELTTEHEHVSTDNSLITTALPSIITSCTNIIKVLQFFNSVSLYEVSHTNISILSPLTKFYTSLYSFDKVRIYYNEEGTNAFLWYNVRHYDYDNKSLIAYCKFNVTNPFYIDNLLPGEYYVFCLYSNLNLFHLSPFDCQGFLMPLDSKHSTWLRNDKKGFLAGMLCVHLMGLWLVGGSIAYIAMRINPSLLKGSKNVEMVKSRVSNSNENNITRSSTRRLPSNSNKQCMEEYNRRIIMSRSLSETSISSYRSKISYVSAVEPTPKQLYSWRKETFESDENVIEIYVEPPELPPRNSYES